MSAINLILFGLYAFSALAYTAVFRGRSPGVGRMARPALMAALLAHAFALALRARQVGMLPVTTVGDALFTTGLCLAAVYLWLEIRQGSPMTGMFVLPVAALLVLPEALGVSGPGHPSELLKSPLFALHTLSAVSSYCAFALAAVHGILYLMLYRELKRGRASLVFHRLPSLEQLARILIRSTTSGFVLLGVAIAIGFVWISHVRPGYYTDPKALLTLLVWLVFGSALLAHQLFRQNPTLPVYISLAGFCLLLLATLVPGHVSGSFHQFR